MFYRKCPQRNTISEPWATCKNSPAINFHILSLSTINTFPFCLSWRKAIMKSEGTWWIGFQHVEERISEKCQRVVLLVILSTEKKNTNKPMWAKMPLICVYSHRELREQRGTAKELQELYKVSKAFHRGAEPFWLQCFPRLCQVVWMSFGWWTILDTHGKLLSVKNQAVLQLRLPHTTIPRSKALKFVVLGLPGGAVVKGAVLQRQLRHQRLWVRAQPLS